MSLLGTLKTTETATRTKCGETKGLMSKTMAHELYLTL